jgi:hypothetical protein
MGSDQRRERFKARMREERLKGSGTTPPAPPACQPKKIVQATQDPISRYFNQVIIVGAILAGLIAAAIRGFFF